MKIVKNLQNLCSRRWLRPFCFRLSIGSMSPGLQRCHQQHPHSLLSFPPESASRPVDIPSAAFWSRRQGIVVGTVLNYIESQFDWWSCTTGDEQRSKPVEANPRRPLSQSWLEESSLPAQRPPWCLAGPLILPPFILCILFIIINKDRRQEGDFSDIPVIIGHTKDEGVYAVTEVTFNITKEIRSPS